ncbi:unnamed protein product [Danaus chrysippus]|uniref:(African queen) hypothetical protein n=1 Tax=Danaus chrysippus TaxID=151541 RepID=A0A8J2QMB2_9NEOP|nr:unnamed protein product [Danaus chrysippus]
MEPLRFFCQTPVWGDGRKMGNATGPMWPDSEWEMRGHRGTAGVDLDGVVYYPRCIPRTRILAECKEESGFVFVADSQTSATARVRDVSITNCFPEPTDVALPSAGSPLAEHILDIRVYYQNQILSEAKVSGSCLDARLITSTSEAGSIRDENLKTGDTHAAGNTTPTIEHFHEGNIGLHERPPPTTSTGTLAPRPDGGRGLTSYVTECSHEKH